MELQKEALRLGSVATFFVVIGWIAVIYALIAGALWWIDLASRAGINIFEAFAISATAVGGPIFLALIVAAFGHGLRLFAMSVASRNV
jgi:hypothetical protein